MSQLHNTLTSQNLIPKSMLGYYSGCHGHDPDPVSGGTHIPNCWKCCLMTTCSLLLPQELLSAVKSPLDQSHSFSFS